MPAAFSPSPVLPIEAGAAPHLPASIFSPLNGEKGPAAMPAPICNVDDWRKRRRSLLSPRVRGEMPGRAMRGSADDQQS
ncbi:hypothetical protein FJ418_00295 [Mesorhizobium sp. B2-8-3]|nr:hypothetical protein FJ418_00295 [Mesorhizobium sp. B2-8-3]